MLYLPVSACDSNWDQAQKLSAISGVWEMTPTQAEMKEVSLIAMSAGRLQFCFLGFSHQSVFITFLPIAFYASAILQFPKLINAEDYNVHAWDISLELKGKSIQK